jgi:hypothetical protein
MILKRFMVRGFGMVYFPWFMDVHRVFKKNPEDVNTFDKMAPEKKPSRSGRKISCRS